MNYTERACWSACRPADTRNPGDWAKDNIQIGGWSPWPGKFTYDHQPWLGLPFADFRRKTCHRQTIVAASAGGKSTFGLMCLAWVIANDPGTTVWWSPTEPAAKEFAELYIAPTLDACAEVRRLYPANRNKKRDESIIFPHMAFFVLAANRTNAQSKHIRYSFRDETWLYAPGLLAQIGKRTERFKHNRKEVDMSTGGEEGDETCQAFRGATAREWQFRCPRCDGLHVPFFSPPRLDAPGGVKWDPAAKVEGHWDRTRLRASVRYECPLCQTRFAPTDEAAWSLNVGGCYTGGPPAEHESYHWSAIVSDFTSLPAMAVEFIDAKGAIKRGDPSLLQEFVHKREAGFWSVDSLPMVELVSSGLGYRMGDPWPEERVRFLTVDVQQREFWAVVRAWAPGPQSRLVWAGRLLTWEEVRKCQQDHGVTDSRVFVDAAHYTDQVYQQCCLHDWNAIRGEEAPMGFSRERRGTKVYEPITEATGRGTPSTLLPGSRVRSCTLLRVSESLTSDSLHLFRTGRAQGWTIADDAPEEYRQQLAARVRRERKHPRTGQAITEWVTVGSHGEHCWDMERVSVGAAYLAGILNAERKV